MLTVEPEEPHIHNVRIQHAYRTTVTLRNNSRNALELSIRAGSPERWAVAPSTVFLEAGRTMRVDLRLKLTRPLQRKRTAGGAGPTVGSNDDPETTSHRQRDVFHVKTPFFERRFHASFTVADEAALPKEVPIEDRGRSVSYATTAVGVSSSNDTRSARSVSPNRVNFVGSDNRSISAPPRRPPTNDNASGPGSSARVRKSEIHILDTRLDHLERVNKRAALDIKDKDELIRALHSRLELARNATSLVSADDGTLEEGEIEAEKISMGDALQQARSNISELTGANTALRSRIQELDGESKASKEEAAGLRRRVSQLASDKAPELTDLVSQALAEERNAYEQQSVKVLRVLEAKDAVLAAREREVAEARAEHGAAQSTLTSTRKELDVCEEKLIATLDETSTLRAELSAEVELKERLEKLARDTAQRLTQELDSLKEKTRDAEHVREKVSRLEEELVFARAESDASSSALEASRAENFGLRISLKSAAELRVAERTQLAALVSAATHELNVMERLSSSLNTIALRKAHSSLALVLESSKGDALLTGAAAEAALSAETKQECHSQPDTRPKPSGGKPPLSGAVSPVVAGDETLEKATASVLTSPSVVYAEATFLDVQSVNTLGPQHVVDEFTRLVGERDLLASQIEGFRQTTDQAREELFALREKSDASASQVSTSSKNPTSHQKEKEIAALRVQVKELQTALRLKDGEFRRIGSQRDAERAAETEALRTELSAMRDRLKRAASDKKRTTNLDDQNVETEKELAEAERRIRAAESKAAAAESEATVSRERLLEYESNDRRNRSAQGSVTQTSSGAEERLSTRVTELTNALSSATRKIAELENTTSGRGEKQNSGGKQAYGGKISRHRTTDRSSPPGSTSSKDSKHDETLIQIRWENERARLESKLRAAREDGAVRVQSLEATVASLRSRSGLHAEVARLGDAIGSSARAEIKARHDLKLAEEKLGKALLRLRELGVDEEVDEEDLPTHLADQARRLGSIAVHGGVAGGVDGFADTYQSNSKAGTGRDAARYQAEIDRLRAECERVSLETGREASARADASRELAAALDRVAERDRALHDVREQAALGRERAAATRARELGEATRSRAAAEARACESDQAACDAREEARAARAESARRVAAADAARRHAERISETAKAAASVATGEATKAKRDAERAVATLDERAVQLRILTETVEALQASAGSGDREQKIVTLAAQAATARASEAALERRCAELSQEASSRVARVNDLEQTLSAAELSANAADVRADAADERESSAREERAAAREETSARVEEAAALARQVDTATDARASAEAREAAARQALEQQHQRHVEQLHHEREAANDRLRKAADDAARAAGVVGIVGVATYGNAFTSTIVTKDELVEAANNAAAIRERIERHLRDVADSVKSLLRSKTQKGEDKENKPSKKGLPQRGTGASFPAPNNITVSMSTDEGTDNRQISNAWALAVLQRLRQLVLEAERDIGRATSAARTAAAGESAAHRRAAAAEAALDARTAAWEEATAAATAAEEQAARREAVGARCAEERARHAYARVEKLEDALASATRQLTDKNAEATKERRAAKDATRRAETLARRARVAEADAAAAKQAALAAAEELEGSPNGGDAVRDLKAYFESEVVGRMILGDENKTNDASENVRLVGVTRELCAAKLTERSLLASLAANRRRADAAAVHAVELRGSLDVAEQRLAEVTRALADKAGDAENEAGSELAARLSREAHTAREETLRLRARVSELELECAELAGAREAAAAAAKAAREGARAEIAAAAARDNEAFAAKAASLRRDAEAERDALRASLREAQSRAQTARAETVAMIAEGGGGPEDSGSTKLQWRGSPAVAASEAQARAEKAEQKLNKAKRLVVELKDELKLKDGVVEQLRRAFGALDVSTGVPAKRGGKRNTDAPDPAVLAASAVATSAGSNAALGRRLVEARLAEADSLRKLKITAHAEAEYRAMVADRDSKLVELERKLRDAGRDILAGVTQVTGSTSGGVASSGSAAPHHQKSQPTSRTATPRTTPRATPTKPAFKPPGTTSKAAAAATEGKDGANAKGKSIAQLAAASAAARRGLMPPSVSSSEDEVTASLELAADASYHDTHHGAYIHSAPASPRVYEHVSPEVAASGDIASALALESELVRLRVKCQRADAEVERLTAELDAFKTHAPEPEEMDALRDESNALRERIAVLASVDGATSPEELQSDIHAAVVSAATALSGGNTHFTQKPKPGTAAAATEQLIGALRETRNELFRAKQELRDASRSLRERGKEKSAADSAEESRRDVIRELTQRASTLGRDKAELMDERDKLRERCRALRKERDNANGDDQAENVPGMYTTHTSSTANRDATTQAGPARGDAGALVDATALGEVLRQRVAGVERAAAYSLRRAKSQSGGDVAEAATEANALAVDAAALRATVEALCSTEIRDENLSPTEMVTAAAVAAMRAMPDAPVVHHVMPSVVVSAMVTAPLVADPNVIDAPMAWVAKQTKDAATDVECLAVMRDVGVDALTLTSVARSGPDAKDDPEVVIAAPRDQGTSPGIGERVRSVSVGVGVGGWSSIPPPGEMFPPETRETGVDPVPITLDTATSPKMSTAQFKHDMTAVAERDALAKKVFEFEQTEKHLKEKSEKWKVRCESLRLELAKTMEKTSLAEQEVTSLREQLAKTESHEKQRAVKIDAAANGAFHTDAPLPSTREAIVAALSSVSVQARDAVASADALRLELNAREEEHARSVSATRTAIRNLRGSSPADRAAYLEALRISTDNAASRRREREGGGGDVLRRALNGGGGNSQTTAPSKASTAALAKHKLAEENADALLERVLATETRLERAVASTATALAVAEQGARRLGDRLDKEAQVIASRVEETDRVCAVAIAKCEVTINSTEERGKKARWGHVTRCARYRDLLRKLLDEHKQDRTDFTTALAEAEAKIRALEQQKRRGKSSVSNPIFAKGDGTEILSDSDGYVSDVSPPKRRRGLHEKESLVEGRVSVAVAEIEKRRLEHGRVRRATKPPPASVSSAGSDFDVGGPAATAAKAELNLEDGKLESSKPKFTVGGGSFEHSDVALDQIPTSTPAILAAQKARELLGKLLASRDDVEKLDWLERKAVDNEREAERLRLQRDRAIESGAKAERRARHLQGRVEQLRRAAAEAEKAVTVHGRAAFAELEKEKAELDSKLKKAKLDGARLKAVTGDIKSALDRVKVEKARCVQLEKSLAVAEARVSDQKSGLERKDAMVQDLSNKLDLATHKVAQLESVSRASGATGAAHKDELRALRDERDKLASNLAITKERHTIALRDAALEAETAERERTNEITKRMRREAKRKDQLLASVDERLDAVRLETDMARREKLEAEKKISEHQTSGYQSAATSRRHSVAMLGSVRTLAQRVCRLAAAVGHTVGAANGHKSDAQSSMENAAASLVDFAPDEIAALLGADDGDRLSDLMPIRGGKASTPESFHKLVSTMETKVDSLLNSMVASGDAFVGVGGEKKNAIDSESLRWIVAAAEAEAEHAEQSLKAAVPSMEAWWDSNGEGTSVGQTSSVRNNVSENVSENSSKRRGKQSKKSSKRDTKEDIAGGTRANLSAAARLLASSGDEESN